MSETSTARRREVGGDLRIYRQGLGFSVRGIDDRFGWPSGKTSRLETGKRPPNPVDVARILGACHPVPREDYDRLIAMAEEPDNEYWVRPGGQDTEQLCSVIKAESRAETIASYQPTLVPGLLQTESYARAVFGWQSNLPAEVQEDRIQTRLTRQQVFQQLPPPQCVFFVHERALRAVLGDTRVMHEQLLSLVLTTGPRRAIRVVPESAGPLDAVIDPFMFFGYPDGENTVYLETLAAGLFVDAADTVTQYREILRRLDGVALGGGQSREWLANLAGEYDRMEANSDECPDRNEGDLAEE